MRAAITPRTRIVFVANPNNPTGTWIRADALAALHRVVARDVLVVLDEAYNEYLDPSRTGDTRGLDRGVPEPRGLAHVLEGVRPRRAARRLRRDGTGVADLLNRVRQPFNVNALAQAAAIAALAGHRLRRRERAHQSRRPRAARRGPATRSASTTCRRTATSCSSRSAMRPRVYDQLLRQGVIVRPVANYGLPEYLRVTVGLPEENERSSPR